MKAIPILLESIKKELPVQNSRDSKISQLYCSIFG